MSFRTFGACFLGAVLMALNLSAAQNTSDSTHTPAAVYRNNVPEDDMHQQIKEIHQVVVESPLDGKDWGVEVDPILPLFSSKDLVLLYGTVSNFSLDRGAEIAFPISYQYYGDQTILSLDAAYRYFLSGRQRGFYLSAFMRDEYEKYNTVGFDSNGFAEPEKGSTDRFGIGFGMGDRIFSRKGLYWGWSFSIGRFLTGHEMFGGSSLDDNAGGLIFDLELLKVGYAFP